jgi:hypothetical protein
MAANLAVSLVVSRRIKLYPTGPAEENRDQYMLVIYP